MQIIFPECSRATGKTVDRTVTILDLKGVSLLKLVAGKVKHFLDLTAGITQKNYPETLGQMYIINAGYFFSTFWAVFKGILDPVTVKKIHIISGDGKSELLKIIDSKNLPQFLGGEQ